MKKNIKNFINKHYDMFVFVILFISIIGFSLNVKTIPGDEMWNFQNIYKMYNGYKIYIDANVITTPLFHVIGLVLFKILGANFFVFRLYNLFINLFLFFGVYKLFNTIKVQKSYSLLFTILIIFLKNELILSMANYNTLAIVFIIYASIIYLNKQKYSNKKFIILESLFIILIFLTKQSIGVFYLTGFIITYILFENNNNKIRDLINISILILLTSLIFLLILNNMGLLNGFLNYTIFGINEFASNNIYIEIAEIPLLIIPVINFILINTLKKKNIGNKEIIINLEKLIFISLPLLLIMFPIFNITHITFALFLSYIILLGELYIIVCKINIIRKIKKVVLIFLIFISIIISLYHLYGYYKNKDNSYSYNDVYFGVVFDDETKIKVKNVTKYIKESKKKVIIVSTDAVLYMTPLKQNNGYFDELLLGNLGKEGEDGVIEKISELDNTIILINKEDKSYQESDKIRDYIKNKFEYIGTIEDLQIYETK